MSIEQLIQFIETDILGSCVYGCLRRVSILNIVDSLPKPESQQQLKMSFHHFHNPLHKASVEASV